VLQGADLVLPALSVSSWVYPLLVTAAVGGFPILLVLTWIFDVNRGGIQRTPAALSDPLLPGDKMVRRALQILGIGFSGSPPPCWDGGCWADRRCPPEKPY
jgi:hypothetical protein